MTAIGFSRAIGPVPVNCVVSEKHQSDLEITEIPIETGARITDHAFVLPKRIVLDIASANAAASFNALVAFQESRVPFSLVTGLKVYPYSGQFHCRVFVYDPLVDVGGTDR